MHNSSRTWSDLGAVALLVVIVSTIYGARLTAQPAVGEECRWAVGARDACHGRLDRAAATRRRVSRAAADDDVADGRRRLVSRRGRRHCHPPAKRRGHRAHVAPDLRLHAGARLRLRRVRGRARLCLDGPGAANRPDGRIGSRFHAVRERVAAPVASRLHARVAAGRDLVDRLRLRGTSCAGERPPSARVFRRHHRGLPRRAARLALL